LQRSISGIILTAQYFYFPIYMSNNSLSNLSFNNEQQNPFRSFWMGGYECTDQLNAFGNRVDFLTVTGHLQLLDEDYKKLSDFNIKTVREGIRWSQVEKYAYKYDWSTVEYMMREGKANNIQQVWDLCHFGFPDDLTPLHPMFARRFAALCRAFVHFYRSVNPEGPLIVTPINEVSFLSWLGGDVRGTAPYCVFQGWQVKYALMRAYIEGVAALKEEDPSIQIMATEPLMNWVAPLNAPFEDIIRAEEVHEYQYQAADLLTGRLCPELGGRPEFLDILGVNYYYDNQRVVDVWETLPWANEEPDPRWVPLHASLLEAYERYKKPLVIAETSHPKEDRPKWIKYVAREVAQLLQHDLPFWGVCIYPIIDRPDWDHLTPWHSSGLWDAELREDELPGRILYQPFAEALLEAQKLVATAVKPVHYRKNIEVAQNF
jgi:hypothetical protein